MELKFLARFPLAEASYYPGEHVRHSKVLSIARDLVKSMKEGEPKDKIDILAKPFAEFVRKRIESADIASGRYRSSRGNKHISNVKNRSDADLEIDILRLLLKSRQKFDSLPKMTKDLDEANRLHKEAVSSFDKTMSYAEKKRFELNDKINQFSDRKNNFNQLISDNINKIDRQQTYYTECRASQIASRKTLNDLIEATKETSERCNYFAQQINSLKGIEKFVLSSIKLLPEDYLKNSVDPVRSLMLRFQTLNETQEILKKQYNTRQQMFQEEMQNRDENVIETTVGIFQKEGEIQSLCAEYDGVMDVYNDTDETRERVKQSVNKELSDFICILRAIRNISQKAGTILLTLEYTGINKADLEKMSLKESFNLIHFLLSVIFGIQNIVSNSDKCKKRFSRRYLSYD